VTILQNIYKVCLKSRR